MADTVLLDPYIFFAGTCAEAMECYKGIFGGELRTASYDDMPDAPKEMKGKLMHALLEGPVRIMASDTTKADAHGHGKIHLSLSGADDVTLRKYFDALADGGEITMPLQKQMWGDEFGTLTDKFGVNWMVNIASSENAQK